LLLFSPLKNFRTSGILNKRRLRPSLPSRKHLYENDSEVARNKESSKQNSASPVSSTNSSENLLSSSSLLRTSSGLNPYAIASYGALNSVLANPALLAGVDPSARASLPFTHFLANFDQTVGYDSQSQDVLAGEICRCNYSESQLFISFFSQVRIFS